MTLIILLIMSMVALRKESVDRNPNVDIHVRKSAKSLSARRAWIEISSPPCHTSASAVALRKESVDRNSNIAEKVLTSMCRSPQGERG